MAGRLFNSQDNNNSSMVKSILFSFGERVLEKSAYVVGRDISRLWPVISRSIHRVANSPKMITNKEDKKDPRTCLHRQHFAMFPLNRHYNVRNSFACEHYNFSIK
ncbi:hypothetical protein TNCV_4299831 [Trichonephila clavipes]|nr:hypothetical protein TNCV_4299831 [Trichonephila clavipes]